MPAGRGKIIRKRYIAMPIKITELCDICKITIDECTCGTFEHTMTYIRTFPDWVYDPCRCPFEPATPFYIKDSRIPGAGLGAFSTQEFYPGDILGMIRGIEYESDFVLSLGEGDPRFDYCFELNEDTHILPVNGWGFCNDARVEKNRFVNRRTYATNKNNAYTQVREMKDVPAALKKELGVENWADEKEVILVIACKRIFKDNEVTISYGLDYWRNRKL